MNPVIEQMLGQYGTDTLFKKKNSIKEVIQEITLCGLSRAGFFSKAAFYGGTALRIFYGLDRFSEGLDFSLKVPDPSFDFSEYLPLLEKEVNSYGLKFNAEIKEKSVDSNIKSAFMKGNTKEHMLMFYSDEGFIPSIPANELIKVKFEVDINPPVYAGFETKYRLLPIPYEIGLYDMPSLFAGKIHAILCRTGKNRVKGRDLYDYIFYLSRGTDVNLRHLAARLVQSGRIDEDTGLSIGDVKEMLKERFDSIDYSRTRQDVLPFIANPASLDVWKAEFFNSISEGLEA